MKFPEILALIPARGGSKGIPRKNVRLVAGEPLIAHAIMQAQHASHVNRVIVSTDDSEIANISYRYGAEVIERPIAISGDTASSESALLHALDYLQSVEGYTPDWLVFLQCTSPLTLAKDIDATVQVAIEQNADSALSVASFHRFLWQIGRDSNAIGINHDKTTRLRRQDREIQYIETGAIYVMKVEGFLKARHRFFGETALYVMPSERCLEIDEPIDFSLVEALFRERQQHLRIQALPNLIGAIILDFDGVFTDNRVVVFQDGSEAVICHRGDGWGLAELKALGLPLLVISTEENPVVQARCNKLGISCQNGIRDKLNVLNVWLQKHELLLENTVYVGNDINDLACLQAVGCGVVPHDAHPDVYASARIILDAKGGQGAIRELADLIKQKLKES